MTVCAVLDSTEIFHVGYGMKPLQLLRLWRITCQSSIKQPTPTPHPHLISKKHSLLEPQPTPLPLYSEMVDSSSFLMFGCMTSNFMWLLSLSSLVTGKMSSLNQQGFQIALFLFIPIYFLLFQEILCFVGSRTQRLKLLPW